VGSISIFWNRAHVTTFGKTAIRPGDNQIDEREYAKIKDSPTFKALVGDGSLQVRVEKPKPTPVVDVVPEPTPEPEPVVLHTHAKNKR